MFCPKCGKQNDEQSEICHSCRTVIKPDSIRKTNQIDSPITHAVKINSFALASMILGIVGCIFGWSSPLLSFLPSVVAVIFGHIIRMHITRSKGII